LKFSVILADPAWSFSYWSDKGGGTRRTDNHYNVTAQQRMESLHVQEICADNCICLMWCSWTFLEDGISLMRTWGFKYKSGAPWLKLSADLIPRMGTGYRFRACSEFMLIGTKGNVPAPKPADRMLGAILDPGDVDLWNCDLGSFLEVQGAHSAKPESQYTYAEQYPGPYCELFARHRRDGWVSLGNELDGLDLSEGIRLVAENKPVPVLRPTQLTMEYLMAMEESE